MNDKSDSEREDRRERIRQELEERGAQVLEDALRRAFDALDKKKSDQEFMDALWDVAMEYMDVFVDEWSDLKVEKAFEIDGGKTEYEEYVDEIDELISDIRDKLRDTYRKFRKGDKDGAKTDFEETIRLVRELKQKLRQLKRRQQRDRRQESRKKGGSGKGASGGASGASGTRRRVVDHSLEKLEGVDSAFSERIRRAGVADLTDLANPEIYANLGRISGISKNRLDLYHEQARLNACCPELTANELEVAVAGYGLRAPLDKNALKELATASDEALLEPLANIRVPVGFGVDDVREMVDILLNAAE